MTNKNKGTETTISWAELFNGFAQYLKYKLSSTAPDDKIKAQITPIDMTKMRAMADKTSTILRNSQTRLEEQAKEDQRLRANLEASLKALSKEAPKNKRAPLNIKNKPLFL